MCKQFGILFLNVKRFFIVFFIFSISDFYYIFIILLYAYYIISPLRRAAAAADTSRLYTNWNVKCEMCLNTFLVNLNIIKYLYNTCSNLAGSSSI